MNSIVTEFRARFTAETPEPVPAPINRGTPNPPRRIAPNDAFALPWCRQWIPGFGSHERQVIESDRHRAEILAKVRG